MYPSLSVSAKNTKSHCAVIQIIFHFFPQEVMKYNIYIEPLPIFPTFKGLRSSRHDCTKQREQNNNNKKSTNNNQ